MYEAGGEVNGELVLEEEVNTEGAVDFLAREYRHGAKRLRFFHYPEIYIIFFPPSGMVPCTRNIACGSPSIPIR